MCFSMHACVACAIIADRLGLAAAGDSTLGFLTHSRPIPLTRTVGGEVELRN